MCHRGADPAEEHADHLDQLGYGGDAEREQVVRLGDRTVGAGTLLGLDERPTEVSDLYDGQRRPAASADDRDQCVDRGVVEAGHQPGTLQGRHRVRRLVGDRAQLGERHLTHQVHRQPGQGAERSEELLRV